MGFYKYLRLEKGRALNRRYSVIIIFFLLAAGFFLQNGIGQYKHIEEEKKNFLEFEKEKHKQFFYPAAQGNYGFRLFYSPSPLMALSPFGPIPDCMTAFIDASERMKIYQPLKGQNAFFSSASGFLNLAGFLLIFGSAFVLLYGFCGTMNHKWLKFQEGTIGSRKKLFSYLLTARAIIILAVCLVLAVELIILFLINGIWVNPGKILIYVLKAFLMLLCFLLIGLGAGALRKRFIGVLIMVGAWFGMSFLYPALLNRWTYDRAAGIKSTYKMELSKLKYYMDYERGSYEKAGKFDKSKRGTDNEREMFLQFWKNGFESLMNNEKALLDEMKEQIAFNQLLAGLCPTTSFLSMSNEMGSRGFSNLVAFNEYSQQMKKDFIWYIAENYILSNKDTFPPFIKGNENIFEGESRLPDNFQFGVAVKIIWLLVLLFLFWLAFNRLLSWLPETEKEIDTEFLKLDEFRKNKITAVVTVDPFLLSNFIETLRKHEIRSVFVPGSDSLPGDIKLKSLFDFFGLSVPEKLEPMANRYIYSLNSDYKALVLLEIVRSFEKIEFFIFDRFLAGLSEQFAEYFSGVLDTLKKDRKIACFTSSIPKVGNNLIRRTNERRPF